MAMTGARWVTAGLVDQVVMASANAGMTLLAVGLLPSADRAGTLLLSVGLGYFVLGVSREFVGNVLLAQASRLEGLIAKVTDSRYHPGRRSQEWLKHPFLHTQEVVLGGWRPGQGRRDGTIGALLLGAYDDDGLRYIGDVGTGFTDQALRDLHQELEPLAQRDPPFVNAVPRDRARRVHWLRPERVGEVEYRKFTVDGVLRHSSWRGLRPDRRPEEVRCPD